MAWRIRSGLAQRVWNERKKDSEKDAEADVNAPFKESNAKVADARRRMGLVE